MHNLNITPFTMMVDNLMTLGQTEKRKYSSDEYEDFKKQWLFDAVAGKRYGQAFCDYFKLGNATPIYYMQDNTICEKWIHRNYIKYG